MDKRQETSPDELLDDFRGRPFKSIIVFTLVVHAVILVATSIPYLWKKLGGAEPGDATTEERLQAATREATSTLQRIAEEHGVTAQDLSEKLAGGGRPAAAAAPAESPAAEPATRDEPAPASDEPKSAIEQELETSTPGPAMPPVEEEEIDLFK